MKQISFSRRRSDRSLVSQESGVYAQGSETFVQEEQQNELVASIAYPPEPKELVDNDNSQGPCYHEQQKNSLPRLSDQDLFSDGHFDDKKDIMADCGNFVNFHSSSDDSIDPDNIVVQGLSPISEEKCSSQYVILSDADPSFIFDKTKKALAFLGNLGYSPFVSHIPAKEMTDVNHYEITELNKRESNLTLSALFEEFSIEGKVISDINSSTLDRKTHPMARRRLEMGPKTFYTPNNSPTSPTLGFTKLSSNNCCIIS